MTLETKNWIKCREEIVNKIMALKKQTSNEQEFYLNAKEDLIYMLDYIQSLHIELDNMRLLLKNIYKLAKPIDKILKEMEGIQNI